MPLLEPELYSEKSAIIKENGIRYIECAERVVILLEDIRICQE